MTTYDFEVKAKREVIELIKDMYEEEYDISDISVVWMTHVLGNKKAVLIDSGKNTRLYEVTYNAAKDEMYVDMYVKVINRAVHPASSS